jgi:hypothetical protein
MASWRCLAIVRWPDPVEHRVYSKVSELTYFGIKQSHRAIMTTDGCFDITSVVVDSTERLGHYFITNGGKARC